ncbi:MAG: transposase [Kiritimatiellia bacterium]
MPRASRYLIEGYTYHLTHRCHGKEFLLRARKDRQRYREWLREGVARFRVPVYAYSITRNHVHVVVHAVDREAVGKLMQLAAGSLAMHYNPRNNRNGSMWEHPYHCTIIQDGRHLLNCIRYIDLNMVRAGEAAHPREWRWCGYDELTGQRSRYRILDINGLAERVGFGSADKFHEWYKGSIEQRLSAGGLGREEHWTTALAVGSENFVSSLKGLYPQRVRLSVNRTPEGGEWVVHEERSSYGTPNSS